MGADAQLRLGSRIRGNTFSHVAPVPPVPPVPPACGYQFMQLLSHFPTLLDKSSTRQPNPFVARHSSNWGVTLYGEEQGSVSCKHRQRPILKLEQSGELLPVEPVLPVAPVLPAYRFLFNTISQYLPRRLLTVNTRV